MQTSLKFDDQIIANLTEIYTSAIFKIFFTNAANFLAEKQGSENTKFNELVKISEDKSSKEYAHSAIELNQLVMEVYQKYPELQKIVDEQIDQLREQMISNFLTSLDEDAAADFLTLANSEMQKIPEMQNILDNNLNLPVK